MTIRGPKESSAAFPGGGADVVDADLRDGVVVDGISVDFRVGAGKPAFRAVDRVNFEIRPNETLALVGESGSGKTTTARAIMQLVPIAEGKVYYRGTDYTRLGRQERRAMRARMQMVYQSPYSSLDPRMSIANIVAEPLRHSGMNREGIEGAVREVLGAVGLGAIDIRARPGRFSGGQRQRIAIARAIVAQPWFVVCDEPVSALDVSAQAQVLQLLRRLQQERDMTYLFVSHDLAVVRVIADRVAVMYRGRIVEVAQATALEAGLRHPYSIALRSAVEREKGDGSSLRRRIMLAEDGEVGAADPETGSGAGCPFRERCWLYRALGRPAACASAAPELVDGDGTRAACHFADESQNAAMDLVRAPQP